MGGVETSRGIAYQNAQAVLTALDVLTSKDFAYLRVEGTEDILDIEIHDAADRLVVGKQIKTRIETRPWGKTPILDAIIRWFDLGIADAEFEFVTDGRLGTAATQLRDALDAAAAGNLGALATFLDVDLTDPDLPRFALTKVREDVTGSEAVLAIAEREVRSLLPGARTEEDLRHAAKGAVDALLRDIANRSGSSDPSDRVLSKGQIADLLGGVRGIPTTDRWPTGVRDEYRQEMAQRVPDLVKARLHDELGAADDPDFTLANLIHGSTPIFLSGRTGSGKSSVAEVAVHEAATAGLLAIRAHAQAYVPGRLPALVADALSAALHRALPTVTGLQALADPATTVIIDGASEIPAQMRQALAEDLRPILTSHTGAQVVLVGRDRAVLANLVPTSVDARRLTVVPLDHEQKAAIVRGDPAVSTRLEGLAEEDQTRIINDLIRNVEKPLGDAAGNPMLFSMALQITAEGQELSTDADLYTATIARLAERSGITDVDLTATALGVVFARLLDKGRRFVYPYEYRNLLSDAVEQLATTYFEVDAALIAENIRRSGLLVALGTEQLLVPVHDSYADYLAGIVHARGLAPLPDYLTAGDERRIEFAVQSGGLTASLASQISRDLPFTTVRLVPHDRRRLAGTEAAFEVSDVLAHLLPPADRRVPALWKTADQVIVALVEASEAEWLEEPDPSHPAKRALRIVLSAEDSPLAAAAKLWRVVLKMGLRQPHELASRRPSSPEDAADLLRRHVEQRRAHLIRLVDVLAPAGHTDQVRAAVGPGGMTAAISTATESDYAEFPVIVRPTKEIEIEVTEEGQDSLAEQARQNRSTYSTSSVEHLLRSSPQADAAAMLKKAIEKLTENAWLQ